jgi:hypothetical protein
LFNKLLQIFIFISLIFMVFSSCGSSGQGKCEDDFDCDFSEVCNPATSKCEKFVCKKNEDCGDPKLKCESNKCLTVQ